MDLTDILKISDNRENIIIYKASLKWAEISYHKFMGFEYDDLT